MTIAPFNASTYVADRNTAGLVGLKGRLDTLTTQLASGKTAGSYGGLGSARTTSLSAHAALSALEGYDAAITGSKTRVALASAALTQVGKVGSGLRNSLLATNGSTFSNTSQIASNSLEAALDALNQSVAGQYIFGGRATDAPPVVSSDTILNGNPSAHIDGLKTVIAERKAADGAVSPGTGNLGIVASGTGTVTLSEAANPANRANFGFTIGAVASSNPNAIQATLTGAVPATVTPSFVGQPKDGDLVRIAVNQPDGTQRLVDYTARVTATPGPQEFAIGATAGDTAANLKTTLGTAAVASAQSANPPGISLSFSGGAPASLVLGVSPTTTPVAGDTVSVTLGLHDGTTTTVTLTATAPASTASASATQFQIGATPDETARNLQAALAAAVGGEATTTLAAASAATASQDFFAGSRSTAFAPRRVDTANGGFVSDPGAAGSRKTAIWYTGDDTSADPRATAKVQASASRTLDIGVQANEAPIRSVLAGIAMVAADSFTAVAGTTDATRYNAVADRARTLLGSTDGKSGLQGIASDLGLAASDLSDAQTQNRSTRAALQDSLEGVDTVSTESVTAQLLQLQTQLQASYQVTSMLSKLTLTSYL